MNPKKSLIWGMIILIAVFVRFYSFKNNIYFGFDEARDALVSENIYTEKDFKLIGPPATGDTGLYHGPAYWYLVGPLYILFGGNLYVMSALFRIINILGVFLVFGIAKKLFSEKVGFTVALLYALSFEQSQYSLYVGKESLALICWLTIIYMATAIYKKESKYLKIGLPIIAACFGLMLQFNIIYAGYSLALFAIFIAIFPQLKQVAIKSWLWAGGVFTLILSTYIVAELKYNFREIRSAYKLIHSGFGIMSPNESKYTLYWGKYLNMFRDNILGLDTNIQWQKAVISSLAITFTIWLLVYAIKETRYKILIFWMLSWVGVMLAGGHMAYYTNVAASVPILIGVAVILEKLNFKNLIVWIILLAIICSNGFLVYGRRNLGLIQAIKPQPYMNLVDEKKIIEEMYSVANGKGFTLRLTGIPYKIQTVWFYLLREYGYKKYGYFPYWEHGNIVGYPGKLPVPSHGTTCVRFLVREPMTGLPVELVNLDTQEENFYSAVLDRKEIGMFTIENRYSIAKDCHNDKP